MKLAFPRTAIRVWAIVLIVAMMITALPGCGCGGSSAVVKDGVIVLQHARVDFGDNEVPATSKSAMNVVRLKKGQEPAGLISPLFELTLDLVCRQPVTVSFELSKVKTPDEAAEGTEVVLGVGTEVTQDDGTVETSFTYVPAKVENGVASATFVPTDYIGEPEEEAVDEAKPSRRRLNWGFFRQASYLSEGGHFIVYLPGKAKEFHLGSEERNAFLSDLEDIYEEYLDKGYAYDRRQEWPMAVYIQTLGQDGYYSYRRGGADGQIHLNRELFQDGYRSDLVLPLVAREFFHFVQLNYVDPGSGLPWFDKATAVYFEGQKAGAEPGMVDQHADRLFTGVFPEIGDAFDGYARVPLITYLAHQQGEAFILNTYSLVREGAGWGEALNASAGAPATWAGDFYEALVRGEMGSFSPQMLYTSLADGKGCGGEIGTKLGLEIPAAEEIEAVVAKGEDPLFGSTTVRTGPYGAQLVALTVDQKNVAQLSEGSDPAVSVPGADLRIFVISSGAVEVFTGAGGSVTLKDFKTRSDDSTFLALVTGLHESGQADYTVTVGLPAKPTFDEVVGVYPDGSLLFAKIDISDEAIARAESGDESGCDPQVLSMLKGMEGRKDSIEMVVEKIDQNDGVLQIIFKSGDIDKMTYSFTFVDGILLIDQSLEEEGQYATGSLDTSYGGENEVVLDGDLNISDVHGEVNIVLHLNGSKPLGSQ